MDTIGHRSMGEIRNGCQAPAILTGVGPEAIRRLSTPRELCLILPVNLILPAALGGHLIFMRPRLLLYDLAFFVEDNQFHFGTFAGRHRHAKYKLPIVIGINHRPRRFHPAGLTLPQRRRRAGDKDFLTGARGGALSQVKRILTSLPSPINTFTLLLLAPPAVSTLSGCIPSDLRGAANEI